MRCTVFLFVLLLSSVQAQGLSGTFTMQGGNGTVTLELRQSGNRIEGGLSNGGTYFTLVGEVDDQGAYGVVHTEDGELYFEAELIDQGLLLILADIDPVTGSPDPSRASQFVFAPVAGAGAPGSGQPPIGTRPSVSSPDPVPAQEPPEALPGQRQAQPAAPLQMAPTNASTTGELAQTGRRYDGGTRVDSPWSGVSFTIPAGYYAGYSPEQAAFLMVSDFQPGLVWIEALSHVPLEASLTELSGVMETDGLTLVPQGPPQVAGDVVRAAYTANTQQGQGVLHLVARSGPSGNVLITAALGAAHEQQQLRALLDGLVASAQFGVPRRERAREWQQRLSGRVLSLASYSSSNGLDDGAFEDVRTTLDLCSDGSYAYQHSYSFFADVPGLGAHNVEREEDLGSWQIEFSLLGPVLALHSSTDGGRSHVALLEEAGTLYVDGRPAQVASSERCQ